MPSTQAELSENVAFVLESHGKHLKKNNPPPALLELNRSGIRRFEQLKFPHHKHEMFTYASTQEVAAACFEFRASGKVEKDFVSGHTYKGCEKSRITLTDGEYRPGLSDISGMGASLKIMSLAEAASDPVFSSHMRATIENENDAFAAINGAFASAGCAIRVAKSAHFEAPLQILHVSTGSDSIPVTTSPKVLIHVEALGEIKIIVRYVGLSGNYFVNSVTDFLVDDGAGVVFTQVQADAPNAWHFSKNRIHLHRDSRFLAANASSGCKLARHHYEARLKEPGAELRLNGVSVLAGEEQVHQYLRVYHEAPHCTSRMHFKNIVDGKSRSSIDGTVIVKKDAQLTDSNQLINNLILSDDAHANSKPNLMIFADDVKCTHGNTVGQVDEEQMFYLKTRGLSQEAAQTLLTRSFAEAIIETIEFPMVREDVEKTLLRKLEANHA